MYKVFDREEFRLWLIDRFEPEEILMFMNVTTEDILEAFPEEWEENEALIRLSGLEMEKEENEDDD